MKILIFPCDTIEALVKVKEFKLIGINTIGANSQNTEYVSSNILFNEIYKLPHVFNNSFKQCFLDLIANQKITHVWSSLIPINSEIPKILMELNLKVEMLSAEPVALNQSMFQVVSAEFDAKYLYLKRLSHSLSHKQKLTDSLTKYILNTALAVPGESHFDKLLTITQIYETVPNHTDIVEIGTLWGRTAKLFSCLNKVFNKGNLLCIDPWASGESIVQNTNTNLDKLSLNIDGNGHFSIFLSHLVSDNQSLINYIRDFSTAAYDKYLTKKGTIVTDEFGITHYEKRIGLLHIDGNHKYESVKEDIENYAALVVAGGWIIFDDYNWVYGDGVTIAADEYLNINAEKIDMVFFCGGALFVKLL
ncbi:class I SAM-dependent methyltransferase [Paraglaciecola arctica]|uniref:Class I SAM-dependent methyltransferase n=1 Tax=Paraglaciecola arctica BSs20135 TaxID=493475 RepID=K6XGZ6_9ALTE|nr:class I SAM-dependent methyltransferase [Paraglaciecola arctica]GAC19914.1 hypothetical protein GARC_2951 [Paraglaciecola arctica BSs20135]